MAELNGYDMSRAWFNWSFENPELINPTHSAIYFFAIEHCNRLGWKDKFGFPSQMVMEALGIKKHHTYIKYFEDLCEWGFFKLVQKSSNQYSANIISLQSALPKNGKAMDKALIKHAAKQVTKQVTKQVESTGCIDKPLTINKEPLTINKNWFLPDVPGDTIIFPFESDKFKTLWARWKEYRYDTHQKDYKAMYSEQSALKSLSTYNESEACAAIEKAIAGKWSNLYPEKIKNNVRIKESNRTVDAIIPEGRDYGVKGGF